MTAIRAGQLVDPDAGTVTANQTILVEAGLNTYFASLGPDAPVRTLADVIEFNEQNADREMPYFGQQRMISSQARGPLTDQAYIDAKRTIQRANREDGIDRVMNEHNLDAIVAPTRDHSFFGRAWSEPTLIRIAGAYENATNQRQPPTFADSLG